MSYRPMPHWPYTIKLSARDRVQVTPVAGRYSVSVTLAPGPRPTTQVDDGDERLLHGARFRTAAAATALLRRVLAEGAIDLSCWTWTPREHGRLVGYPLATPYQVER